MSFFTRHGCGRTLLLTVVVAVGTFCVSNGADRPSVLVGQWIFVAGYKDSKAAEEKVELFSDGTGVVDGMSLTWKVENKRLMLLTSTVGIAADYKASGDELVLTYDNGFNATFVKKGMEEERKKRIKREVEQRLKKISTYFTDSRNGQKYRAVKIGGKTWMAHNLNYQTGKSWCYENSADSCVKYGRLYDWETAKMACPAGWHLPSDQEWENLVDAAEKVGMIGKKLRATGWDDPDDDIGTDEYGFSILPGGWKIEDKFENAGELAWWWSATKESSGLATRWGMGPGEAPPTPVNFSEREMKQIGAMLSNSDGISVRCVQDN